MNLEDLKELSDWMRSVGATRAKVEGVELELGAEPPKAAGPEPKPEPEALCHCGCPVDQHGPAGCLNGCIMEACVGSGQRPAPEGASEQ